MKVSDKWTGEERRRVIVALVKRADFILLNSYSRAESKMQLLTCTLMMKMVCQKEAVHLQNNRQVIADCLLVEDKTELF